MRRPLASLLPLTATLLLGLPIACGKGGGSPAMASAPASTAPARPNFVVILADDMAYGLFGAGRRLPFLSLPNLEQLAASGVQFDNAFVTTSVCSPSRASIFSGLYAHSHGVLVNDTIDLPATIPTFPQLLQTAGYRTAFIGKWHQDPTTDAPRPGFDYWASFRGQGPYHDPLMNVNGVQVARTGYVTDVLTDYATAWLREQATQPFLLVLSHKAPHGPWEPPARDQHALPGAALPEPASYRDSFRDKPAWQRRYALCGGAPIAFFNCPDPLPASLPSAAWSASEPWRLDYLRTLLALDESVGAVGGALARLGLGASTYVLFMSDNGFLLGEHRLADKRLAYEESLRIPLVVSGAGLAPRQPQGPALNIDVAPTLLELAGVPAPTRMQGRSLAGVLRGAADGVRDAFLYEYWAESLVPVVPRIVAIRTRTQKLVTYPTDAGEQELYDLAADPHEMTNLASRAEWLGAKEALQRQLDRLLEETGGR